MCVGVINSAHMAKGLEFDEVIIPQVDDQNYHSEIDRSMLSVQQREQYTV